ncbi:MAG: hypothetical protein QOI57_2884 [Rubrobacteraceae bacterium]|jgi:hypothetical protein|nr:hypothetical protein [Rubrobacteraceae bacterium]
MRLKGRVRRLKAQMASLTLLCVRCRQEFRVSEDPLLRLLAYEWRHAVREPYDDPLAERLAPHELVYLATSDPLLPALIRR